MGTFGVHRCSNKGMLLGLKLLAEEWADHRCILVCNQIGFDLGF